MKLVRMTERGRAVGGNQSLDEIRLDARGKKVSYEMNPKQSVYVSMDSFLNT